MQKHPIIKSISASGTCPYAPKLIFNPQKLSRYAFQRYLHKSALVRTKHGIKSYRLPCGCYVIVYPYGLYGVRVLSGVPY